MFASVEVRVPYCTPSVFKALNGLSFAVKTDSGATPKHILKRIARRFFDQGFIHRPKLVFTFPIRDWFRDPAGLGSALDVLQDETTLDRHLFDADHLKTLINDHTSARADHARILWMALNVELWHRLFIDRTEPARVAVDPLETVAACVAV